MCERMFHVKHSVKMQVADVETAAEGGRFWQMEKLGATV